MFGRVANRFCLSVMWKSSLCGHLLFPATLMSKWVSSRGTPAPYGVVIHRCVPFLLLYKKSVHYINIAHLSVQQLKFDYITAFQVRDWL